MDRSFILHSRAGNGTRTRDPNLGKVVLYQLSYSRVLVQPTRVCVTLQAAAQSKHFF